VLEGGFTILGIHGIEEEEEEEGALLSDTKLDISFQP
jgi:hypothetical protein